MTGRLTVDATHPILPDTFCRCQLCGFTNHDGSRPDICEFRMWWEADDEDHVTEDCPVLITCKGPQCKKVIDDHPRLYQEVPWSRGGPGRFMLLCGNCKFRQGTRCTHPNLRGNGGPGLEVQFSTLFGGSLHVCFADGTGMGPEAFTPATSCEGNPK